MAEQQPTASTADFCEVVDHELDRIVERREAAGERPQSKQSIQNSLVGLALSGGGIRSACVSLGVLQTFAKRGVLRFVDYMSTVSGGGYAGAFYDAHLMKKLRLRGDENREAEDKVARPRAHALENRDPCSFDKLCEHHGLSLGIQRIIFGRYLRQPMQFVNRYLIGLVLMLTLLISGLLMTAALSAWCLRLTSHPEARWFLSGLGFRGDVWLAVFPTAVLSTLWVLAWFTSYFRMAHRATGGAARVLLFLTLLSIGGTLAVLISTGDIAVYSPWMSSKSDVAAETANNVSGGLQMLIFSIVAAGLLPYLNPQALFRSGVAPKNMAERATFWVASRAVVIGLPFVLVALFCEENISNANNERNGELTRTELSNWATYDGAYSPLWQHLLNTHLAICELDHPADSDSSPTASPPPTGGAPSDLEKNTPKDQASGGGGDGDDGDDGDDEDDVKSKDKPNLTRAATLTLGGAITGAKSYVVSDKQDRIPDERLIEAIFHPKNEIKVDGKYLALDVTSRDSWRTMLLESSTNHTALTVEAALRQLAEVRKYLSEQEEQFSAGRGWINMLNSGWAYLVGHRIQQTAFARYWLAKRDEDRITNYLVGHINAVIVEPKMYKLLTASKLVDPPTDATLDTPTLTPAAAPQQIAAKKLVDEPNAAELKLATQTAKLASEIYLRHHNPETAGGQSDTVTSDLRNKMTRANRELLRVNFDRDYSDAIHDREKIFSYVVLEADQRNRLSWALGCGGIFVAALLLVNLNATSLHGYYAEEIDRMWIDDGKTPELNVSLDELRTTKHGGPYHLINGMWHLLGDSSGTVVGQRHKEYFLMSPLYCGNHLSGFARTDQYMGGQLQLADAVAISGGAISPLSVSQPLVQLLLVLVNFRLGQWLNHPRFPDHSGVLGRAIGSHFFFSPLEFIRHMSRSVKRRCFISDGGLFENLGIEQLLHRRCRLIIAVDSSQDENYKFGDFADLSKWSHAMHGVQFTKIDDAETEASMEEFIPNGERVPLGAETERTPGVPPKAKWSQKHWLAFRIKYPPTNGCPAEGVLIVVKPTMTGDEPESLISHRLTHDKFPHDDTSNQFYTAAVMEAYRSLGEHMAQDLLKTIASDSMPAALEPAGTQDFVNHVEAQLTRDQPEDFDLESALQWADFEALIRSEQDLDHLPAPEVVSALLEFHRHNDDDEVVDFLIDQLAHHACRSAEALRRLLIRGLAGAAPLHIVETTLDALLEMGEAADPQRVSHLREILDEPGRAPVKTMIVERFPAFGSPDLN